MSALKIGLTGGIGAGKSAVTRIFENNNIVVIDADIIAREVVDIGTPCLAKIVNRWGEHVLNTDGSLNRSALRGIIFNSADDKQWLNSLLHPVIQDTMQQQATLASSAYVVVAVPLLIENKSVELYNRILVIDCPESLQVQRAMQRDGNTEELIQKIIHSQASRAERLKYADDVIENSTSLQQLEGKVSKLHEFYLSML